MEKEVQKQISIQILLKAGYSIEEAISHSQDVKPFKYDSINGERVMEIFNEYYNDNIDERNSYISVDYKRFLKDKFTEFTIEGIKYLYDDRDVEIIPLLDNHPF